MPIKTAQEGLQALNMFPSYNTRADYLKAFGVEPPAFDHTAPPKYWQDPSALNSDLPEVVFPRVPMKGAADTYIVRNGAPVFRPLVLTKEVAAAVNIPDEADLIIDQTQDPNWVKLAMPCPMRELEQGEAYGPHPIVGVVVLNTALYQQQLEQVDAYTRADRAKLDRIIAKLGA